MDIKEKNIEESKIKAENQRTIVESRKVALELLKEYLRNAYSDTKKEYNDPDKFMSLYKKMVVAVK